MTKALVLNWQSNSMVRGGTETVAEQLANMYDTKVICARKSAQLLNKPFGKYYPHAGLDRATVFDQYVEVAIKTNKPDILIRNSGCGGFIEHKIPTITLFQDNYKYVQEYMAKCGFPNMEQEFNWSYPLLQKLTSKNSINIANSNLTKKYMEEIGAECHHVVPLGIDLDLFKPGDIKMDQDILVKYKKVGLWVGKFHCLKYTFIDELIKKHKDIFWILVFAEDVKLKTPKANNVKIYMNIPQEELKNLYDIADFTLSTSPVESFGLTSIESMACGTPIIAFKTGIFFSWTPENAGIIVEDHNVESFSDAIKKVLDKEWDPRVEAMKFDIKIWNKKINEIVDETKHLYI